VNRLRLLKAAAFTACAAPLAKLILEGWRGALGANPVEAVMNRLGWWTLALLALSLAATPAHDLLGLSWPARLRRMVGLFAFAYGTLHLSTYLVLDQFFAWDEIAEDILKRPFITVGFAAWLVLLPLAVTSTRGWVRRLGYPRWKRLHRAVYLAAGLGVLHFVWRVKADLRQPTIFAGVIGMLLLLRALAGALSSRRRARPATAPPRPGPAR
jgi:methionine sulfoxide reductase heme-binding subunit